jgi:hypothetical protein
MLPVHQPKGYRMANQFLFFALQFLSQCGSSLEQSAVVDTLVSAELLRYNSEFLLHNQSTTPLCSNNAPPLSQLGRSAYISATCF